jgi:hypothetical protein
MAAAADRVRLMAAGSPDKSGGIDLWAMVGRALLLARARRRRRPRRGAMTSKTHRADNSVPAANPSRTLGAMVGSRLVPAPEATATSLTARTANPLTGFPFLFVSAQSHGDAARRNSGCCRWRTAGPTDEMKRCRDLPGMEQVVATAGCPVGRFRPWPPERASTRSWPRGSGGQDARPRAARRGAVPPRACAAADRQCPAPTLFRQHRPPSLSASWRWP